MAGETKLKGFDFVKEWATQLITLASATLVLSATFYKDMISGAPSHPEWLERSWFLFFASVVVGVFVLGSLVAYLNAASDGNQLDAYSKGIVVTAVLQIGLFGLAMWYFTRFVAANMVQGGPPPPSTFSRGIPEGVPATNPEWTASKAGTGLPPSAQATVNFRRPSLGPTARATDSVPTN